MLKSSLSNKSSLTKILALFSLTIFSMLIFTAFYTTIHSLITHQANSTDLFKDPGYLKGFQLFQSIGTFIIPSIVFAYIISSDPLIFLNLKNKVTSSTILIAIMGLIALNPFINLTNEWNESMNIPDFLNGVEKWMKEKEEAAKAITETLLVTKSVGGLIFNIFFVGVVAGVGEELFFRGVIQKLVNQITGNTHAAIWITAFIFSAIHVQFYGFIPRFLLGALFGYLLVWTGNLLVPIILHTLNNSIAVILFNLKGIGYNTEPIETFGTNDTIWYSLAGIIIFALLMHIIIKKQSGYFNS